MKTLHYLKTHHILLPRHQTSGLRKGELLWKEPTESIVVDILHNPAYAGAFVYGRRPADPLLRKPGHRGSGVVRKPMEEWVTIQQGVYPAYITWEAYLRNQERLAENAQEGLAKRMRQQGAQGAAREGSALLQGLMCCGMCGYRMRVAYKPQVRYLCDGLKRHYHEKMCMSLDGASIEEVVVNAFFDALRPAQLDALQALLAEQAKEEERLRQYHRDQVTRASRRGPISRGEGTKQSIRRTVWWQPRWSGIGRKNCWPNARQKRKPNGLRVVSCIPPSRRICESLWNISAPRSQN